MRNCIVLTFIFLNSMFLRAQVQQPLLFREAVLKNCQCKQYSLQPPNKAMKEIYDTDSSGLTVAATQYWIEDGQSRPVFIDSLFYNGKQQITEMRSYLFNVDLSKPQVTYKYTYDASGQLSSSRKFHENMLQVSEEYRRDEKGRPLLFMSAYYREDGSVDSQEQMAFTFTNDTLATFRYSSNGKFIANGKHIYNRRYQILDEVIENPATGKKVHFVWKYDNKGKLISIHKEKVIVGDAILFWSTHYIDLHDSSRKLEYTYDSKGRVLTKKVYMNIELDKVIEYQYTYE
jgi:hypothetical protein